MVNFTVIVACITGVSCPLPHPVTHTVPSASTAQCRATVSNAISTFGYNPKLFIIDCKPAK